MRGETVKKKKSKWLVLNHISHNHSRLR